MNHSNKYIFTIIILCITVHAQSSISDLYKQWMIEDINKGNFERAAKGIVHIEDWDFDDSNEKAYLNIDSALAFIDFAEAQNLSIFLIDSFRVYLAQEYLVISIQLYNLKSYDEAISNLLRSLEILRNYNDIYLESCAQELFLLGQICNEKESYFEAEKYYLEAYEIFKNFEEDKLIEFAPCLNNLGALYVGQRKYSQAEKYYLKAMEVVKQINDKYKYAASLNNIGQLYYHIGNYAKSKECYLEAYEIFMNFKNDKQVEVAKFLNNLGLLYCEIGDYNQAEELLNESLTMRRNYLGENDRDVAESLNNLGLLYLSLGDIKKTEMYYLQANEIFKNLSNDNPADFATSLSNLGYLYIELGDYDRAFDVYTQALSVFNESIGVNNLDCVNILINLGYIFHQKWRDYKNAELFYTQALKEFRTLTLDSIGTSYATTHSYLGDLYLEMKDYNKADMYYNLAMNLRKLSVGENHLDFARALNNLGHLYYVKREYEKAKPYFIQSRSIYKNKYLQSLDYMSEKQRSLYWQIMHYDFEKNYTCFSYIYSLHKPSTSTFAYNNELFVKGLLFNSSEIVKKSIKESKDSTLIHQWNELSNKKLQIIVLEQKKSQIPDLDVLQGEAEVLEKEITRKSAVYRENLRQWNITWDSVRDNITKNQVAIEYMSAPLNEDSTMYCALLLRDTCSYPIMIPLFEEKEVAWILNTSDSITIDSTYNYIYNGKILSNLIWENVLPYLKLQDTVFFAPTGILHQIAIENLPYDSTHIMGDIYNLIRLSSTRDLVLHKQSISPTSAALFGGINYDATPEDLYAHRIKPIEDEEEKQPDNTLIAYNANRDSKKPLPGTKIEVREIDKVLTEANVYVQRDTAEIATEEAFKALSGKHKHILHLATHGFYWQDSTAQKEKYFTQRAITMNNTNVPMSIDPLERCGLLFAGANTTLDGKGKRLEEYGVQDGVLTAKEISTMDLRDAELVVLSACETGLGDITGDGVFGLQRAFKMAGAQTIIMSLWKVDDNATQLLMTEFYKHWVTNQKADKLSKREAFRKAQNTVRAMYKNPKDWAGFILLD